jgi:hypothetical protein
MFDNGNSKATMMKINNCFYEENSADPRVFDFSRCFIAIFIGMKSEKKAEIRKKTVTR